MSAHTAPVLPSVDMDTSICSHLRELVDRRRATPPVKTEDAGGAPGIASKLSALEKRYTEVVRWGALDQGVKRRKTLPPKCSECSASLARPWACLTCDFIGCAPFNASSSRSARDCLLTHFADSTRCEFAVDPTTGAIFCSECDDCVYPDSFESLFRTIRVRVEEEHDTSREGSLLGGGRGRGRGNWRPWEGDSALDMAKGSCKGLRPLLNLSQTCFLSAILQALIHNPLLKAYFLSDKHNRHVCTNGARGLAVGKPNMGTDTASGTPSDRERGCMCCEMDRAFEEFYSEDTSPYAPITMLYSMWHASTELEGHGQQDAHAFFLAALEQIHQNAKGQLSSCNCIAHQTFAGSLVSSVTCSKCSATNSTVDPTLDIQLDMPFGATNTLTLAQLLRRFCAPERLDHGGKGYECEACGGGKGVYASKKMSIKKLPPVLAFQLKRFAHNSTSSKVETPVRFPSHLDMKPYVEPSAGPTPAAKASPASTSAAPDDDLPPSLYHYDLFAVVTHEGKLDNGHYWADVRSGDEWWHCDDDKVTPTTLANALKQKAYMLFYVRRTLAYGQPMSRLLAANAGAGAGSAAGATANGTSAGASGATKTVNGKTVNGKTTNGKGHGA